MGLNLNNWIMNVVGAVVAIIMIVTVAIPIISENLVTDTNISNADAINSMLSIVPILMIVGVVVVVIGAFISSKKNA